MSVHGACCRDFGGRTFPVVPGRGWWVRRKPLHFYKNKGDNTCSSTFGNSAAVGYFLPQSDTAELSVHRTSRCGSKCSMLVHSPIANYKKPVKRVQKESETRIRLINIVESLDKPAIIEAYFIYCASLICGRFRNFVKVSESLHRTWKVLSTTGLCKQKNKRVKSVGRATPGGIRPHIALLENGCAVSIYNQKSIGIFNLKSRLEKKLFKGGALALVNSI